MTVEFHRHNIATANVLARDDFKDILRRCRTFWTNSHKTQAFFTAAIGRINLSTTSVLRISDIPAKISVGTAKVVPRAEIGDGRTVKLNTSITVVSLDGSKRRPYKISSRFKVLFPDIFDELLGKSIGSTVTLRDGKFTITDIT